MFSAHLDRYDPLVYLSEWILLEIGYIQLGQNQTRKDFALCWRNRSEKWLERDIRNSLLTNNPV